MSILRIRPVIAVALLGLTTTAAFAETPGRFTMSPVEGGFIRLDKETGAMALCSKKEGGEQPNGWACVPMADDQRSLREELDQLKTENTKLKDEIRRLEETFVTGKSTGDDRQDAGPPGGQPPGGLPPGMKLPSEEDVDRAVDYLEGMIRKFRERFEDFGDKTDPDRYHRDDRGWRDHRDRRGSDDDRGRHRDSRGSTPL